MRHSAARLLLCGSGLFPLIMTNNKYVCSHASLHCWRCSFRANFQKWGQRSEGKDVGSLIRCERRPITRGTEAPHSPSWRHARVCSLGPSAFRLIGKLSQGGSISTSLFKSELEHLVVRLRPFLHCLLQTTHIFCPFSYLPAPDC